MRLTNIALTAFIAGFSGAMMPGPVLAAAIWYGTSRGFWAGPALVVGHMVLELSVVLALAAGLARYLARPDAPLVRGIGLVGGVMLLLMAFDMFRGLPQLSLHAVSGTEQRYGPVAAGLALSAVNPYFWIWWATIGLGLFGRFNAERGKSGLVAFYTGHILADFAWYSLVTLLLSTGRSLLDDGVYRALIGGCAAMLVVFGARFAWFGARGPQPHAQPV